MSEHDQHMAELREIVAEVLEVEPEEVADTADFVEEYEADSLRAIEILARIEKKYKVEIPQAELNEMRSLKAVHEVVARYAGWQD
ncbi:acyl carrier protein [Micromonospora globbae]|jgi:acyl carrier protein|uniref:Acyl carrier protein n=1 Tax=Micromonospora globbae TaxID=1894969 RepID=A0A420EVX0_9ACTN|nr:acyl carrier protein [Micromonospora globbae]RKF24874.1 acyl carrier protein [Micromonospora globbae]WTF83638.1 acyl carrier protein [Micromonospora globbae]